MNYIPLQVRTDATLLKSATKPDHIVKRLSELGIERCALTDEKTLASSVEFLNKIPDGIIGCNLNIYDTDVIILCKNKDGFYKLIELVSAANSPQQIRQIGNTQDIICICKNNPEKLLLFFRDLYIGLEYNKNNDILRQISKETGIPCVALCNSYYTDKTGADDQRVLISMEKDQSIYKLRFDPFFISDEYHIPSYEEMKTQFTDEELKMTFEIGALCEPIDIKSKPRLPHFPCPNNMSDIEYLKQLCREGFKQKIQQKDYKEYGERAKYELNVLEEANLASYFLIVRDIIQYVQNQGFLTGVARGSAAGCLVSYLIGITQINPLKYDLIFERFYNASRKGSLPDIDIDIPHAARQKTIQYLKNKYLESNVSQLITFQTMQGRNALKGVLRAYEDVSAATMDKITQNIIDKAKIADELAELEDKSLIKYSLEHKPEKFKEWCSYDNGELVGQLANRFKQAIKLEGTRLYQSKHPAGVIIADQPLSNICPMIWDKQDKQMLAGMEMEDLEAMGIVKIDILGITMLDKLMDIQADLAKGIQYE